MSFINASNVIEDDDSYTYDYSDTILLSGQDKSFKDLDNEINGDLNKSLIILEDNYVNNEGKNDFSPTPKKGIFINRSVTIDGQGHVIDANWSSRIFHINADNVILKNIIFKKSVSSDAGAIYCNGRNIMIINSTFIDNCIFNLEGAAINYKYGGMIINSTFINNYLYKNSLDNKSALALNFHNESISFGINCEEVHDIISFEKNYNVTIINSNFTNVPEKHNLILLMEPPVPPLNSSYVNNTSDKNSLSMFIDNKIKKVSPKFIAKNKILNKKIKKYSVILKNKNKAIKNRWITLKIKNIIFKAKTNKKGEAIFKINKLNKKGKYKAHLLFKGDDIYNKVSKQVKITIK